MGMGDIPLQADPEEGWIVAAAKNRNALTKQNLENAYYGPMMNAEMASKKAYAQWLPAQLMAQAIASPGFATLDKNQQNALLDRYKMALNAPPPSDVQPQGGQSIFNSLLSLITKGRGGQQQNPLAQRNQGGGYNLLNPEVKNEINSLASPEQQQQIARQRPGDSFQLPMPGQSPTGGGYNTPEAQQNRQQLAPGSNPITAIKAAEIEQDAAKQARLGQTSNQTDEQKAFNTRVNTASTGAIDAKKALEGFHQAYLKSSYKGPKLGARPSSGPESIPTLPGGTMGPEQLADTFQQQYLKVLTDIEGAGGGVTDDARSLMSASKGFSRTLDADAEKVLYESTKAKLERMENSRKFLDKFYKNNPGATVEQATAMMNEYNKHAPAYDYEKSKPLPQNEKKYKDFVTGKALESYLENDEYNPYDKTEDVYQEPEKKAETAKSDYTDSDIAYTAARHNMTPAQVIQMLEAK